MKLTAADLVDWAHAVPEWTEHHAGLGGWVGAVGAILAVFVAWGLARGEYKRDQRKAKARLGSEIDLIVRIVDDFELLIAPYLAAAKAGTWPQMTGFYSGHMNDPEWHSMSDLAKMPVTQWPSLPSYASFKRCWFLSLRILDSSLNPGATNASLATLLGEHDTWLAKLKDALAQART